MSYDSEIMAAIAQELYEFHVEQEHGAAGIARLREVLTVVKTTFLFRSPQSFSQGLVVFSTLDPDEVPIKTTPLSTTGDISSVTALPAGVIIQVLRDGDLRIWARDAANPSDFLDRAVIYTFDASSELIDDVASEGILLQAGFRTVPNPNGYPSALAPPTFWNLEGALDYYASDLACRSTCKILKTSWALDSENRRLVLKNKPESIMRESVAQHLRSSLRDHKLVRVNEEQNVSETEPVDIEVTWSLTSQIALLEVKWLGISLNAAGDRLGTAFTESRARDGAGQLATYLLEFRERTPGHEIKGYLLVFDARRRGVHTWEPGDVTREDAYHYENRDIDYKDSVPVRDDFAQPRRFFLEPRLAA